MRAKEIHPGVYWVGVVDWDRRLFDALIPLPNGTSYNSYLIRGESKTALIDTVDPPFFEEFQSRLDDIGVEKIDYVVTSHGEQDHSGSLPLVLARYPDAQVICTERCSGLVQSMLHVPPEKITAVDDGETLDLGGRTLEFIHAPWVHWPETMLTYLREDKILFPGDLFGSHIAASNLFVTDEGQVYEAAKRYFAEIMMPFRDHIEKHLERLAGYQIELICPSHGQLHARPGFILEAYRKWVSGGPQNVVLLPYVSMHGSTKAMVDHLTDALTARGVTVKRFDLAVSDIGLIAMEMVDAATLVLGTPTVLAGAHPLAVYAAFLTNALRPRLKYASIIGSYGWGGKTKEQVLGLLPNLKVELFEPVLIKGLPREADYAALDRLADDIATAHENL
jgi:flavorubredoxin